MRKLPHFSNCRGQARGFRTQQNADRQQNGNQVPEMALFGSRHTRVPKQGTVSFYRPVQDQDITLQGSFWTLRPLQTTVPTTAFQGRYPREYGSSSWGRNHDERTGQQKVTELFISASTMVIQKVTKVQEHFLPNLDFRKPGLQENSKPGTT